MTCVLVTDITVPATPSNVTVAPGWNAVPVMVTGVPPVVAPLAGPIVTGRGGEGVMVRMSGGETVPSVFATAIFTVPAIRRSAVATLVVSWVLVTESADRGTPFQSAVAPARKSVPVIVKVKGSPLAVTVLGERLVAVGGVESAATAASASIRPYCQFVPVPGM
jgi:hypothetical protein